MVIVIVLAVLVAAGAVLFVQRREADRARREAELQLGLAASRMVNVTFQRRSRLVVSTLSGDVVTTAECQGRLFHPTQRTMAPSAVDYAIDLKAIGPSSYSWNREERLLTIEAPDVSVGTPNVDMAAQVVRQKGVFISRECGLVLGRQTAKRPSVRAEEEARRPENVRRARDAARRAVTDFASGALRAAGLGRVRVLVTLPGDPLPGSNGERWDETRPLQEVLGGDAT